HPGPDPGTGRGPHAGPGDREVDAAGHADGLFGGGRAFRAGAKADSARRPAGAAGNRAPEGWPDGLRRPGRCSVRHRRRARARAGLAAGPDGAEEPASRPVDISPMTSGPPPPVGVLFVCTGNQCRSPMAAALMRARLDELGSPMTVMSAGFVSEGVPPSPE